MIKMIERGRVNDDGNDKVKVMMEMGVIKRVMQRNRCESIDYNTDTTKINEYGIRRYTD